MSLGQASNLRIFVHFRFARIHIKCVKCVYVTGGQLSVRKTAQLLADCIGAIAFWPAHFIELALEHGYLNVIPHILLYFSTARVAGIIKRLALTDHLSQGQVGNVVVVHEADRHIILGSVGIADLILALEKDITVVRISIYDNSCKRCENPLFRRFQVSRVGDINRIVVRMAGTIAGLIGDLNNIHPRGGIPRLLVLVRGRSPLCGQRSQSQDQADRHQQT